jgi:flagellar basal-body rod protein FlgB
MNKDTSIELVHLALDAAEMRQTAIAYNIANSNSANFQAIQVAFEEQLGNPENIQTDVDYSTIKPTYQACDEPTSLDEQMALNVQNISHYRALIKGLNQKFALMRIAIQGTNN